jgi:hypothetical protein
MPSCERGQGRPVKRSRPRVQRVAATEREKVAGIKCWTSSGYLLNEAR